MSNEKMLDGLYWTVDQAFCQGRFDKVNEWLQQIDIEWLFKRDRNMLIGWIVTTFVAAEKLPYWNIFFAKVNMLFPEHDDWFRNMYNRQFENRNYND